MEPDDYNARYGIVDEVMEHGGTLSEINAALINANLPPLRTFDDIEEVFPLDLKDAFKVLEQVELCALVTRYAHETNTDLSKSMTEICEAAGTNLGVVHAQAQKQVREQLGRQQN